LIINAVEAMSATSDGLRELLVATRASDGVLFVRGDRVQACPPAFLPRPSAEACVAVYATTARALEKQLRINYLVDRLMSVLMGPIGQLKRC
jgi:hypothetical protein